MRTIVVADTDVGICKKTNQDSICVRTADTSIGHILMAVICDGMGGLAKGELASATVIREFIDWFENDLIRNVEKWSFSAMNDYWNEKIQVINDKISDYAEKNHVQMGTTVTAFITMNYDYMVIHVGDTRVYSINDEGVEQFTEDQTLVWREVKRGMLKPEMIETDPRRNVLLQCVGASKYVVPEMKFGRISTDQTYMICSDGFRHVISQQEISRFLGPKNNDDFEKMKNNARYLIETVKSRRERDNISVVLIKYLP